MNVETLLSRLKGVRRKGNGWQALCPAHADKNPSLSVRAENEKIFLHCFAGCSIEAICDALKINVSDLFSVHGPARKPEPRVVRDAQRQLAGLRSRVTRRDRERAVTVVLANERNLDAAIARALALAVEGELVQVAFEGEIQ